MTQHKILAALLSALAISACSKSDSSSTASSPGWAPEKLSSVDGVPATEIEAAIQERLASDPPPPLDADAWGHTRRIYKLYGGNALWLGPR